jgi:hypothetical protein
MINLTAPVKPRLTAEVKRDDYTMTFVLRTRRSWRKLSLDERRAALLEGAEQLDVYAQQMREEADDDNTTI